jgi:hypothetical protein
VKVTLDIPALVAAGVIPESIADQIPSEIRWDLKKNNLYRHEMMILDIIGTNKFMRDINTMNPGYIRDVFPLVDRYSIQDGMNHKITPFPRTTLRFTEKTADYFISGVNGEPLKWGNLNADIYVDPISLNMGTVQRQTIILAASEELTKGNADKARALLDKAQEAFPAKNFPVDVYAVYIYTGNNTHVDVVGLYKELYGDDKAAELWSEAFKFYESELAYLSRFRGEKAQGVRSEIQNDLQIVSLLSEQANRTLENQELAGQATALLESYKGYIYQ